MRRRATGSDAGFTLLEAILVVAILAIVASMSAPSVMRWIGPQLALEATKLASALRMTRAAALSQNRDMTVTVDLVERTIASPAIPTVALDRRVAVDMLAPAHGQGSDFRAVRFFASGRSTGGEFRLRLEAREMRVRVNWATGDVLLGD